MYEPIRFFKSTLRALHRAISPFELRQVLPHQKAGYLTMLATLQISLGEHIEETWSSLALAVLRRERGATPELVREVEKLQAEWAREAGSFEQRFRDSRHGLDAKTLSALSARIESTKWALADANELFDKPVFQKLKAKAEGRARELARESEGVRSNTSAKRRSKNS